MARAFGKISIWYCFVLITMAFTRSAVANTGALDSNGCHLDEITGNYHCHQGPLEGREFISKEIAEDTLQSMKGQEAADQVEDLQVSTVKNGKRSEATEAPAADLHLMTWNAKHFGKEGFDYDRVAILIGESDLVVFQDLRFAPGGTDPLQILADVMKQRYSRGYCKAWLKLPSGLRHSFLWRDDRIGFLNSKGEIRESCEKGVVRFEPKKDVAAVTFYSKNQKRMFSVVSIQSDKKPKNFDREVYSVFKTFSSQTWPVFVAGNFQLSTGDKSVKKIKDAKFSPVVSRSGKAQKDNLWFKDAGLMSAVAHKVAEVEPALGDQAPVEGLFSFNVMNSEKDETSVQTLKSSKRTEKKRAKVAKAKSKSGKSSTEGSSTDAGELAKPPLAGKEKYEVYTDGNTKPMETREDLHEELNEADKAVDD